MAVRVCSPIQEDGHWVNIKKKVTQPGNIVQDPGKTLLPSQEITTQSPNFQPEKNKKRKKNKKKSKKKKTAEEKDTDPSNEQTEVIPEPRPQPDATPSHIKKKRRKSQNRRTAEATTGPWTTPVCPKTSTKVLLSLLIIAVISPIYCHALTCTESVPVSDFPIFLHQNDRKFNFQEPVFCPQRDDIFGSCSACFKEKSLLKITCGIVNVVEIRVESGKEIGKSNVVTMSPKDCNRSVEEEPTKKPDEEHHNENQNDALTCTASVPVSDFPIFLHQNDRKFNFQEPVFCPRRDDIFESCSACFEEKSLLKITCGIVNVVETRVESGKGIGNSTVVTMSPEDCNRSVEEEPTKKPDEEHHNENQNDALTCTASVPVSDFPIFLHQNDRKFNFQEPVFCPQRDDIFGSCSACFKEKSLLKITCGIVNVVEIRVESGKEIGKSNVVTMSPKDCNRSVEEEPTEKPDEEHHNENQNESQTGVKEKIKTKNSEDVTPAGTNNGTSYWKIIGCVVLVMPLVGCLIYVIQSERERRGCTTEQMTV